MSALEDVRNLIPETARDLKLNLQTVLQPSTLSESQRWGVAVASAVAARNPRLRDAIIADARAAVAPAVVDDALAAAALMGMNNVWYPYIEMAGDDELKTQRAELRMNAYASSGGVEKKKFEAYALAASIVGKCHFCVASHYALLKKEGLTTQQLRDIGRIAAVVNAAAQVLAASEDLG